MEMIPFLFVAGIWTAIAEAGYTDLQNFIRVNGSLNPNSSVVNYINGSVFYKQPRSVLRKIFNFEGYNINRKVLQQDGSYLSLSREFVVYRDPIYATILSVWINPISNQPNEVFSVANDPVNGDIGSAPRLERFPIRNPLIECFIADIVLEYPNPLDPEKYRNYSAGPVYDSVELFSFFANYSDIHSTQSESVPSVSTWFRKSEYLPWMELSTLPGSLFYSTLSWKCNEGLSCVADDIMKIIDESYPKYRTAPTTDEQPNETSWTVFKKTIDQRREAGLPDIIIPPVNVTSNMRPMTYGFDERVANILGYWPLNVQLNGTAYSEISGKQSVVLFDVAGQIGIDFDPIIDEGGYRLQLDGRVEYYNHTTRALIRNKYNNPITGKVNNISYFHPIEVDYVFSEDSFFSIDIPTARCVGVTGATSMSGSKRTSNTKGYDDSTNVWSVDMINLIFPYEELDKRPESAKFYGTWATFQTWPKWMEMDNIPGNIVFRLTVSNAM